MSDEKKDLESVPLKGDEAEAKDSGNTTTVTTTTKKTWFFRKSTPRKDDAAAAEEGEAGADGAAPAAAEKKACWWSRCRNADKKEKEANEAAGMTIGVNLNDRDEKNLADQANLGFADVFGEPDAAHSWDCVWRTNFAVFNGVNNIVYKLLSLVVFLPAAILFGVLLALLTAANNWIVVPVGRIASVPLNWIFRAWQFVLRGSLEPTCRALGGFWQQVNVRHSDIRNAQTAECMA